MDEETFAFGSFRLIPAERMLLEEGKPLRLGSRALDILATLVERAGETIRKDDLSLAPGLIRSSTRGPAGSRRGATQGARGRPRGKTLHRQHSGPRLHLCRAGDARAAAGGRRAAGRARSGRQFSGAAHASFGRDEIIAVWRTLPSAAF